MMKPTGLIGVMKPTDWPPSYSCHLQSRMGGDVDGRLSSWEQLSRLGSERNCAVTAAGVTLPPPETGVICHAAGPACAAHAPARTCPLGSFRPLILPVRRVGTMNQACNDGFRKAKTGKHWHPTSEQQMHLSTPRLTCLSMKHEARGSTSTSEEMANNSIVIAPVLVSNSAHKKQVERTDSDNSAALVATKLLWHLHHPPLQLFRHLR